MDDVDYERRLNARAVRFGIVLVLTGLLAIASAVGLLMVEFDLRLKSFAALFVLGGLLLFEGGRRIVRGRAPEPGWDLMNPDFEDIELQDEVFDDVQDSPSP